MIRWEEKREFDRVAFEATRPLQRTPPIRPLWPWAIGLLGLGAVLAGVATAWPL